MTCVDSADNIGTMYTPPSDPTDEPKHVAVYLSDLISATWRGFDKGKAAAEEFFAAYEHRERDPYVAAQIARYEARLSLAAEAPAASWDLRMLGNSGIQLEEEPFRVRVLKAYDGGPPGPGRSRARRAFFQQLAMSLLHSDPKNLILYWRFGGPTGLELGLCKPRGIWRFQGPPRLEWRQPIVYDPTEGMRFYGADEEETDFGFDLGSERREEEAGE